MRQVRRFNKKTFKPHYRTVKMQSGVYQFESSAPQNERDARILEQWRNAGWGRRCAYREFCEVQGGKTAKTFYSKERLQLENLRSTAYSYAWKGKKGRVLIDAGCGRSPDAIIAVEQDGFKKAYRIDLYDYPVGDAKTINLVGDVSIRQPKIRDGIADVVVSQAMLDLLDAHERDAFYKEAHRWLKKGGLLSIYIINLQLGFGFDIADERAAVEQAGFTILEKHSAAFVAQKI